MKNILFIFDRPIVPQRGGVQRVTRTIADFLESSGRYRAFFLASPKGRKSGADDADARQSFLPVPHFSCGESRRFVRSFLAEKRIDVVVFQSAVARPFPYVRECAALKIPVCSVFHQPPDSWMRKEPKTLLSRFRRWRKRMHVAFRYARLCRVSSAVALLSEGYRAELCKYLPDKEELRRKICVIPNMVDCSSPGTAEPDFPAKKKELLFVGRLEPGAKRVDLLLRIWAKLEKRFPEWSLRIVGGGGEDDWRFVKDFESSLGLKRVHFEGFQNPEPYYRDASIFCLTSAYEGFGLVLVEAASFGCVPVAFESFAAARDIIADGENGCLVPAFDLDAYAETLARLMSDDALRERLAKNALAQIPEKFSPEKIGAQWEALFRKILTETKSSETRKR